MSSNLLPSVWPDKYNLALKSLDGPHLDKNGKVFVPQVGYPTPLLDALNTEYPSDAHLTQYALLDVKSGITGSIPLIKKHVLKDIRSNGAELFLTCVGLDWDTPGHVPLTAEYLQGFLSKLVTSGAKDKRLDSWCAFYTSRHGTRVFYELEEPVKVDEGEQYVVSLIREFQKYDLDFDMSCKDWTRRFRLPQVTRDGIRTTNNPLYMLQTKEVQLNIKEFNKSSIESFVVSKTFKRTTTHPAQEECHKLLYEKGAQGKNKSTYFLKKAKSILKGTSYYDHLFSSDKPLCGNTGRNDALCKMLGLITPILIKGCEASVEQIFALLFDPLCELELIAGKQDPTEFCWNILQDFYERDYTRHLENKKKEAESVEAGQETLRKMAKGMAQWCDAEELYSDDNIVAENFVKEHLFANVGKFFYPMNEAGWYSALCLMKEQLVPRIRKSYLRSIISTEKEDLRGNVVSVSATEITNKHASVVQEVRMSPLQGAQGRIDDLDGEKPILQLPMYQRNPFLPAEYSAEVDGWLQALMGHNKRLGDVWLGYALDFEAGPICALSLVGAGSVGKKMLVEGLAECLVDPASGTGMDLCGGNNGILLRTPFIFVNEGFPKSNQGMSPSDLFKSYTAGDAIPVVEKYKPRINVINPLRVVLTANDHGLLHDLTRGKELTPETKKALGERILHFDITDDAEKYLKQIGGRSLTEREGARWIRGDSGQDSDFIVAKHFMWLYQNRPPRNMNNRYCVMGNCDKDPTFKMASQSDSLHPVMRGIIGLVETASGKLALHRKIMDNGRVYVTKHGVLAYIREINQERVGERALEEVLKSITRKALPIEINYMSMYELDTAEIMMFAQAWSIPCNQIREAHETWQSNGGIV